MDDKYSREWYFSYSGNIEIYKRKRIKNGLTSEEEKGASVFHLKEEGN